MYRNMGMTYWLEKAEAGTRDIGHLLISSSVHNVALSTEAY